ncbi:hypothetical protein ACFX1Z_023628 [Malus domestica]
MLPALTGPCSINSPASAVTPFHVDDPFLACGASFITTVDFPDQRKSSSSPLPPSSSSSPSPKPTRRPTYPPMKSAAAIQPALGYPNPGPSPNSPPPSDTITFALKSIELGDLGFGRGIHGDALKSGCSSNGFMGSSLMGLYSRCGFVKDATEVLNEITEKDIVVYTSIITGYGQIYKSQLHRLVQMELLDDANPQPPPCLQKIGLQHIQTLQA